MNEDQMCYAIMRLEVTPYSSESRAEQWEYERRRSSEAAAVSTISMSCIEVMICSHTLQRNAAA